jgi:hypothetical protein
LGVVAVIAMRAYAFTGRKTYVLVMLCVGYAALLGSEIWLFGTQFARELVLFFSGVKQKSTSLAVITSLFTLAQGKSGCFAVDRMTGNGKPTTRAGVSVILYFFKYALMYS